MDIGSILIVVALVIGAPVALALAQSRWEIASERRRAARMANGVTQQPHQNQAISRSPG